MKEHVYILLKMNFISYWSRSFVQLMSNETNLSNSTTGIRSNMLRCI